MTASTQAASPARTGGRWKRRLAVVAGAAVAGAAVALVASFVVDPLQTPGQGGQAPMELNAIWALIVGAVASLAGWGLLAVLERFAPAKAHLIWRIVAVVVLLLSLGGPMGGTGVTTGSRVALIFMHLAVGAVLIPLLPGRARE